MSMSNDRLEREYLELLENVFQKMYEVQRDIIYAQKGLQAVMNLFKEFSQEPVKLDPSDPVYQQAEALLRQLVNSLRELYRDLERASPPESWEKFHQVLSRSLLLQIEGYEEMLMAFTDRNPEHIRAGSYKVNQGLKLLEGGERS